MADDIFNRLPSHHPLNWKQKLIAGGLSVAGIIILFVGLGQFRKSIDLPFVYQATTNQNNSAVIDDNTETIALKQKDTDHDGLNDYDELSVYQTSPYLADSDSDGINDKIEIDKGENPNCPTGQKCGLVDAASTVIDTQQNQTTKTENPANNLDINNLVNPSNIENTAAAPTDNIDLKSTLPAEMAPADIREMLKQSGMSEDMLKNLTDEQLQAAYKQTLENMPNSPAN